MGVLDEFGIYSLACFEDISASKQRYDILNVKLFCKIKSMRTVLKRFFAESDNYGESPLLDVFTQNRKKLQQILVESLFNLNDYDFGSKKGNFNYLS